MRRRVVAVTALTVTAGAGTTVSAALSARAAAADLQQAQARLRTVEVSELGTDDGASALGRAADDLAQARAELGRWPVDVVAAVPVLGRSWDVERAVARTASEVVAGALVLADGLPAVRAGAGGLDLAALDDVHARLRGPATRARSALDDLRTTPGTLTPSAVRRARSEADQALGPAVAALERTTAGLRLVEGLLGGSGRRSLLVALQNNAELRGAGGYVSTFGTGRLEAGRVALAPLQDLITVADPPERARRVPAPAEFARDYGPLAGDTTAFRSWNMSPHVPDSAAVGSRVAGALLGTAPDVVVLLDVPAMAALASLGGQPLVLPDGTTVQPDDLTDALLVDAYAQAGVQGEDQVRRRAQLRAAATTAVGRLITGEVPPTELLRTVARLAGGRHLAVWSARADEQAALVDLGLAGAVEAPPGSDLSHVSVNNTGANKLDVYVDRRVSVDVRITDGQAAVVQRVVLTNQAPDGLVPYVAGQEQPGTVISRVELSLPPDATRVRATAGGRPWPEPVRAGPRRSRLVTRVELPRGEQSVLEVRYAVPVADGTYRLRLVPQPLAEDAALDLTVRAPQQRVGSIRGAARQGDSVVERAVPFDRTREVTVRLERSLWERLTDFWTSPVSLG